MHGLVAGLHLRWDGVWQRPHHLLHRHQNADAAFLPIRAGANHLAPFLRVNRLQEAYALLMRSLSANPYR